MDDASADDGELLQQQLQQLVPELGLLLLLVQGPDPVLVMENMAAAALGLTLLLQQPLPQQLPLPKKHAAVQDVPQPQSLGAGGAENGGGDGDEEGAGEKGGGGDGDLLLLQKYRHCKPPSFLRWLWHYKETFKTMPSGWSNNWVKLSFGHRKWESAILSQTARLQNHGGSIGITSSSSQEKWRLLCTCA